MLTIPFKRLELFKNNGHPGHRHVGHLREVTGVQNARVERNYAEGPSSLEISQAHRTRGHPFGESSVALDTTRTDKFLGLQVVKEGSNTPLRRH